MQTVLITFCLNVPFNFHPILLLLVHHQILFKKKKNIYYGAYGIFFHLMT